MWSIIDKDINERQLLMNISINYQFDLHATETSTFLTKTPYIENDVSKPCSKDQKLYKKGINCMIRSFKLGMDSNATKRIKFAYYSVNLLLTRM